MPEIKTNEAQKRAIQHGNGPARVLAGPGSGKTFVIVHRLKYLIEQLCIRPNNILVITFTKAAALEMQERFSKEMNQPLNVQFATFHSLFYNILKLYFPDFSNNILSESDKFKLLQPIIENFEKKHPYLLLPSVEDLLREIGYYKNSGGNFSDQGIGLILEEEYFYEIYHAYGAAIECQGKIDFDDMATKCLHLFITNPEVLNYWQTKFSYILIDEFQDINNLQYHVMKLLAGERKNIFVVGDDDQAIYGFRGSNPLIMQEFAIDYPECQEIFLNINYRCSPEIVMQAGKYISQNKNRVKKEIIAYQTNGKEVEFHLVNNKQEELDCVIEKVKNWEKERNTSDIAIISRTNRENEMLAIRLKKENIPYFIREKKKSIFEHFILSDLCAYLRIGMGERKRSDFLRIMNRPVRYLGRQPLIETEVDFKKWKQRCLTNHQVFLNLCKLESDVIKLQKLSPFLQVNYIRKGMGYDKYLIEAALQNKEKLEEFIEIADFFQSSIKEYTTVEQWISAIETYKKEVKTEQKQEKGEGVQLLTMHGSKGLEYPCVIIPYNQKQKKQEEEEERRMLYVAMTRAKEELEVYFTEKTFLEKFL